MGMIPPPYLNNVKKTALFLHVGFPKTEWQIDKVALIADNFWHQVKYLQQAMLDS